MSKDTVFNVEIADATGHSTVQMTKNELIEKTSQTEATWVFVNDQLVNTSDIAGMNLESGDRV